MPDLLVNLLKLPALTAPTEIEALGIKIRRAEPWELSRLREFVTANFSSSWADEVSVGFAAKPITVYLAIQHAEIVGFAAYECTRRAFFGPTGVANELRGRGVGTAMLLHSMQGLRDLGYVYGIIGGAGPIAYYQKTVGAVVIPETDPGIYVDLLSRRGRT